MTLRRESQLKFRAMGAIRLAKTRTLPERLEQVFRELTAEIERWQPDAVAIEEVFYSVNAKSALKLGQVRGVALLAAAKLGIPVAEYAPLKIKSSVVGYGLAKKEQVQFMVARLLALTELPQPADAADALAIAICHIHTAQTLALQEDGAMKGSLRLFFWRHWQPTGQSAPSCRPGDSSGFFQSRAISPAMDADLAPRRDGTFPLADGQRSSRRLEGDRSPQPGPGYSGERRVCRPRL